MLEICCGSLCRLDTCTSVTGRHFELRGWSDICRDTARVVSGVCSGVFTDVPFMRLHL